jgi:hypothetical protein
VRLRELGYPLAVVLAVHLVLDGALGISAHRVGRPEGWSELAAAEEALEPTVLPPTGLTEQFPGLAEPPHGRPPGLP